MTTIIVSSGGKTIYTIKHARTGQTLLEVLLQQDISIPHECGGMCTCSTCHVYIIEGMQNLEGKSVREEHFIRKVKNPGPGSRLSCQCILLDSKSKIIIDIPRDSLNF